MLGGMRVLLVLLLWVGFLGCGGPSWYVARDVGGGAHVRVGYGEGESMTEARVDAMREISESLGVRVHSTGEMVSTRGTGGGGVTSRFSVESFSGALLHDLTTVRSARVSGRYYLVLGYDNRTLFQKLQAVPGRAVRPSVLPRSGFKAALPLSHDLSLLGISPSDFKVIRRHGGWSVAVGQGVYLLSFETWFRALFVEKSENRGFYMGVTPQGPLPSGSRYTVSIIPPRDMGYLSLYHVSASGQIQTLMANHFVDSLEPILFPDATRYAGLEAIATDGKGSRDMLLAIWDLKRLSPQSFSIPVSTRPLEASDERAFGYGHLIEDLGDALWVSRFVWIVR